MAKNKAAAERQKIATKIQKFSSQFAAMRSEWRWITQAVEDARQKQIEDELDRLDLAGFTLAQDIASGRVILHLPDEPRPLFDRQPPPIRPEPTRPVPDLETMLEEESDADARSFAEPEKDLEADTSELTQRFLIRNGIAAPLYVLEAGSKGEAEKYLMDNHPGGYQQGGWYVQQITTGEWVALPHWITSRKVGMEPPTEAEMNPPTGRGPLKLPHTDAPGGPDWKPQPAKAKPTKRFQTFYVWDDDAEPIEIGEEIQAATIEGAKAAFPKAYKFNSVRLPDGNTVPLDHERLLVRPVASKPRKRKEAALGQF